MRRGTTPTFSITTDTDLTGWDVYVTFEQYGEPITHRNPEIVPANEGGCIVNVELTQEETLEFKPGPAQLQIRAVDENGTAVASSIFSFEVGAILLGGIIPQEV